MSETPKRRLLRKSGLQASPFGAPIKTVLSTSNSNNNNNTSDNQATSSSASTKTPSDIITVTPMANPFLTDPSSANADSTDATSSSQENHSPTRRSARLNLIYSSSPSSLTNGSGSIKSPGGKLTPKRLVPPTTPKTKTILRTGVWGHIVGLKKQDETAYARYPIDKSYCSFGRGDSCDIRVQIDAVSVMHCKLLRRDDGEVWLKDTSTNGTLLNNVLVHDTARPIQHNDVMTIAGRKFRFEAESPISRPPLQSTSDNTPGRQISNSNSNQTSTDQDTPSLAEIPALSARKILTTPSKATNRSTESLEASLGLFTPNRADRLSRLLVSPKPVPFPAFLTKSPSKPSTSRRVYVMIDEPSILNPSCSVESAAVTELTSDKIECGLQTPMREKRMAPTEFDVNGIPRTPKKVSFGPALSPEIFDQAEPPSTPIKRGQQDPGTPRRIATPCLIPSLREAIGAP
ncbi:antigen identified by monoclonal antibody Ki-67 [Mortierella sp. NVP85]|nr:antigen identified by monoclonal antibody Ki-67 [Mortierella sp. NVP85]